MQFLAVATKGLAEALAEELTELNLQVHTIEQSGVWFEGEWSDVYRVNIHSRIANRVVCPIKKFRAENQDQLYDQIRELDLTPYLKSRGAFLIDANVKHCENLTDQRFVAMKVKDAIVDRYQEKFDHRPDVDKDQPDVRFIIRGYKDEFNFSVDTTGDPLFLRGYRSMAGLAPLKETLAAGLIRLTGWKGETPFIDLMCGSGTLPIEAALIACKIAPGTMRDKFSFENFENFDAAVLQDIKDKAYDEELDQPEVPILGFDKDFKAIQSARTNAKRAGTAKFIEFEKANFNKLPTEIPGEATIIANPPYGERMGEDYELIDTYRDLSFILKSRFGGSQAWILSSSKDLIGEMKLKSFSNFTVMNGPLVCRFLGYRLHRN